MYKQQTSRADAFRRTTLVETVTILERTDAALAQQVRSQLGELPIPKPPQHVDGPDSDIFRVKLPVATVMAIVDLLGSAEAAAVATDGTTTREASRFGTLLDLWLRYKFQLDETPAA